MRLIHIFRCLLLIVVLSVSCEALFAQQQEPALIAGFEFRPIIPSTLFRTGPISGTVDGTKFIISQQFGYDLGMVIDGRIWRNLGFETGICYTKRSYSLEIESGNFSGTSPFTIVGYEVPLAALASIPISPRTRFNNSLGCVVDIFPSDEATTGDYYEQTALRIHEFNMALVANTGFKVRTDKSGSFYLGGSYHLPFSKIYRTEIIYTGIPSQPTLLTELTGNYVTLDFKYFFFNNSAKK